MTFINPSLSESAGDDIKDLWTLYHLSAQQLQAVGAEKLAVLAQLTAMRIAGTEDAVSRSDGGEGGGESVTVVSLQRRYDSLVESEIELSKMVYEQRLHAIKAGPGFIRTRIPTNSGRGRYIW